jgi:nucleoside 2-deoxyribosyltransferase
MWERHLRPTIEAAGFACKRADDLAAPGVIIEDVWKEIVSSDVLVADLTGGNPNVFYELGLAHAVGTPVIIATQDGAPFDIAHWRQVRYSDNASGYDQLRGGLSSALAQLREQIVVSETRS